jgi:hypothetical protein
MAKQQPQGVEPNTRAGLHSSVLWQQHPSLQNHPRHPVPSVPHHPAAQLQRARLAGHVGGRTHHCRESREWWVPRYPTLLFLALCFLSKCGCHGVTGSLQVDGRRSSATGTAASLGPPARAAQPVRLPHHLWCYGTGRYRNFEVELQIRRGYVPTATAEDPMAVIVPADISDVTNFVKAECVQQGMSADGALRAGQEAMAARLSQLRTGSGLETSGSPRRLGVCVARGGRS